VVRETNNNFFRHTNKNDVILLKPSWRPGFMGCAVLQGNKSIV